MRTVLMIVISYVFGSVPWALVIGKLFYNTDVRTAGSGNLGASNAGRVLGKKVAVIVTVLDALKAFLSMLLCSKIAPDAVIYSGLACCIGHCFPVFAGFRGGKAVATSFGFLLGINVLITGQYFWEFIFPVLVFFAVLYICRMVSLSSITALLSAAIATVVLKEPLPVQISLFVLWLFVTYRHSSNIKRILNGTENKIKWMG
ncbi:MAG: glycerol-3-phosphate 1-O-acyltransferase PlsY [Solobacterium sp.]|nr:glycerol-3-phosphate 1-O-acyltransferase PlsY [Solobacterium sp.]